MSSRPDEFERAIISACPKLRAQVRHLCRDASLTEDIVQETVMKALAHRDSFAEGTNLGGWLFTIARNYFYGLCRKARREVQDVDGVFAAHVVATDDQEQVVALGEAIDAINRLPHDYRRCVRLVGLLGYGYEEAAAKEGVPVGTIKSRIHRARYMITNTWVRSLLPDATLLPPKRRKEPSELVIESVKPKSIPAPKVVPPRLAIYDHEQIAHLAKSLSVKDVAEHFGCSQATVYKAIRDRKGTQP